MNPTHAYTIRINLKSSIITPLQSDTIFGHICWAVHHLPWDAGEDRLKVFLGRFDAAPLSPPLLVSNGFPKGFLPKPAFPPVTQDEIDRLVIESGPNGETGISPSNSGKKMGRSYRIKAVKNLGYIRKDHMAALLESGLDSVALFDILFRNYDDYQGIAHQRPHTVQRNTINRMYAAVTQGLYTDHEWFTSPQTDTYEVYLKTNFFNYDELKRIFDFMGLQGFGKNKSSGKGAFTCDIETSIDLPESASPNAFMTLSSYVPKQKDPVDGYYHLLHKYGKLSGGHKSVFPETGDNPFKVPLIMMSAGSVFKDSAFTPHQTYGSLMKNVHGKNSHIRQYAYAFPMGIRLGENGNGR